MYHYWKWDKALPKNICDALIEEMNDEELLTSTILGNCPIDLGYRNSKSFFLKTNHWMEGILFNHIFYANRSAGWNYAIDSCRRVQYTSYQTNERYNWHIDHDILDPIENMRKLTAVCQLNDSSEFEGGGLFIKQHDDIVGSLLQEQGDIVVFPSFILHKAEEVTKGTRLTAVLWATGPSFK